MGVDDASPYIIGRTQPPLSRLEGGEEGDVSMNSDQKRRNVKKVLMGGSPRSQAKTQNSPFISTGATLEGMRWRGRQGRRLSENPVVQRSFKNPPTVLGLVRIFGLWAEAPKKRKASA